MDISFSKEVSFGSLKVGELFIVNDYLFLKIPEEDGWNAVNLSDVQENKPPLCSFPTITQCLRCDEEFSFNMETLFL